jgi:hypothetical protein
MTMTRDIWIARTSLASMLFFSGCPKSGAGGDNPAPSAATSVATPASAQVEAAASASASASAATPSTKAVSYGGEYTLTPADYYIPNAKDYASVKQAKDDPSKHVGRGTITLSVDDAGRVTGTVDSGPAAPAIIDGSVVDGEIRGNVRRKDPADDGLTGTLVAKIIGDTGEGTLSLAEAHAAVVRKGKLSLEKK